MSGIEARCENCEKVWNLTKHPDDYKRGVSCPDCGSTRIDYEQPIPRKHEEAREERQREQRATRDQQPVEGARRPDRRDEPPRHDRRRAPARRDPPERGEQRSQMGGTETAIALLDEDTDTQTKAKAASSAATMVGDFLSKAMQYSEQKKQARDQHAQEVGLQKSSNYPECDDCGYNFTGEDISLRSESVQCPDCGSVYDIVTPEDVTVEAADEE